MVPEVTVEEFLTRYRNKHNAYYDVPNDILIEKVLEKYPVYKDKLTDYYSPFATAATEQNNPWLSEEVPTPNISGSMDLASSSLNPMGNNIMSSQQATSMKASIDAKFQRQQDVLKAFQEIDPNAFISTNEEQDAVIDTDLTRMNNEAMFKRELPPIRPEEYSLDPEKRQKQLANLKTSYDLQESEVSDYRKRQTEIRLAGQPEDAAATGGRYDEYYKPKTEEEIALVNQIGPGALDVETLFGGFNYRETINNPDMFSQWLTDARSGKIQDYALERLEKNGPTASMINYANKKYGATSKEEVIDKISQDPLSPWSDYFFPIESYESTHKMGIDNRPLLPNGLINPNYNQNVYYANAPAKGVPFRIWSKLSQQEKEDRVNRGEGNIDQIEQVRNPYKDFYNSWESGGNGLSPLNDKVEIILKGKTPANKEEYTVLAEFFRGKKDKKGNSLDFTDYDRGYWQNFTNALHANASTLIGSNNYNRATRAEDQRAENNLEDWWNSIKENPDVIEYRYMLNSRKADEVKEEFISSSDFGSDTIEKDVLYSSEELNRPLSKEEADKIRSSSDDPMRMTYEVDNTNEVKSKGSSWISSQADNLLGEVDQIYASGKDLNLGESLFDYENMFNKAGNIDKVESEEEIINIPEGAYTGPGSMYNMGKEIIETEGITDLQQMTDARDSYYYRLLDLAKAISSKPGEVGSERYDGTIANVTGKLATAIKDYRGSNETWTKDIERLQEFAKTGKFSKDFRLIRSSHPLAQEFNELLKTFQALHEVIRLDRDPFATDREYERAGGGIATMGSTWDKMFTGYDMFDAIGGGGAELGNDERAQEISNYLSTTKFNNKSPHIKERLHKGWGEWTFETGASLLPLVGEVMLAEFGGAGSLTLRLGKWANSLKMASATTRRSKLYNGIVTATFGGARNYGTKAIHGGRYLQPTGASAFGEMIKLGAADEIGNFTYGRDRMGLTFGASMGYGMSMAESMMQSQLGRKIPFLVPIMRIMEQNRYVPSNFLRYQTQAATGAGIGLMSMQVAEAGQGLANQMLGEGDYSLAEQLSHMKDLDFVLGQFLALRVLGMRPNKVYDGLSKDIHYMFNGPYPDFVAAKKTLGITGEEGVFYKTESESYDNVDDIYNNKADELLNDPKYKGDFNESGYVQEGTELYRKLGEIADAKSVIEGHEDLMVAKEFAAQDQAANGTLRKYKDNLFLLDRDIKSGRILSPELTEWVGSGSVTPEVLASTLGESKSFSERFIQEQSFVMDYASGSGVYNNSRLKNKAIEQSQDLVGLLYQKEALTRGKENDIANGPKIDSELKIVQEKIDDLLNGNKDKNIRGLDPASEFSYFEQTYKERLEMMMRSNEAAQQTLDYYSSQGGLQKAKVTTLGKEEMISRFPDEYAKEVDGFFHTNKDGSVELIVNEEVAVERNPATASHELFHWSAQGAFKDSKGFVTESGKKTIDKWLKTLNRPQLEAIQKRIKGSYDPARKGFYEEHIPIFIDALSKGEVRLDKSFASSEVGKKLQSILGKELNLDLSTPEGITNMVGAINKLTSKGEINPTIKKFVDEKVKAEDVVETIEEVETPTEKVEVTEEVTEPTETAEPTIEKINKEFETTDDLIKELEITDPNILKEIKDTESEGFGQLPELIEITTNADGTRSAKVDVGGIGLDLKIKPDNTVKSKSERVVNPRKKEIISEITELVKDGKEKNKDKIKTLQDELKSIAKPEVKVKNFDDLAKVNYRQYVITDEEGNIDLEKSKEAWEKSPERAAVLEFVYNSPKIKTSIDSKLSKKIQEGDRLIANEIAFEKLLTEIGRFNPGKVAKEGSSTMLSFINTKLGQRSGDVGKSTIKKGTTQSLDKPTGSSEGRVMTKGDNIIAVESETLDPLDISQASMRKNEALDLTPEDISLFEGSTKRFIKDNAKELLSGKDAITNVFETKLNKFLENELTGVILGKMPRGYKEPYKKWVETVAPELIKLADTRLGKDKVLAGDPYVFVNRGGKQFQGLFYEARGLTASGKVKRISVAKNKENPAWDWKSPEVQDVVDFLTLDKAGKPRRDSLRKPVARIIAKTIVKDYTNKTLREGWKERSEGKEISKDNPFSELTQDQFTEFLQENITGDIASIILRHEDFVASSSEKIGEGFKDLENNFSGISKSLNEKWKPDSKMLAIIDPEAILSDMARFAKNEPEAFANFLDAHAKGKTTGDFLKENPQFVNEYFAKPIVRDLLNKAFEGREAAVDFNTELTNIPKTIKWNGKDLDISDILDSDFSLMSGDRKIKGKKNHTWFDIPRIEKYIDNAVGLAEFFPDWLVDLGMETALQSAGTGTRTTGRGVLGIAESIEAAYGNYLGPAFGKRRGSDNPKVDLYTGEEIGYNSMIKSQADRIVTAMGNKTSKAFDGLKERIEELYKDEQMKTSLKKDFKNMSDSEVAEFLNKKISESNNQIRSDIYDAIQKAKEEFIKDAPNETVAKERIKFILQQARNNTNLTSGIDRSGVPIDAVYWPAGKKFNLEAIKLEHLKSSVEQSMAVAKAVIEGKWSSTGEKLMSDYKGVLGPKKLFNILDVRGKETNTSNVARMVLDIAELKNYRTVESGFKETYYDKIIREAAKDINLTAREKRILEQEALAGSVAEWAMKRNETGKEILKTAVENSRELEKVYKTNETNQVFSKSKKASIPSQAESMRIADKALEIGRERNKEIKKARIFDFDDTVARTNSKVFATRDGKRKVLTAEQFAKQGELLINEGWKMDFSDFNRVVEGKKGPLFDLMKTINEAEGKRDVFILTARAPESAPAIKQFLDAMGIKIPLENITGLGKSTGAAKGEWVLGKASEGYNDFYFADDATQNVKAVKEVLDQLDVKSKVQQALSKSKDLSREFNKLVQASSGTEWYKTFSPAKASIIGASKGKGKFFLPSSAEDFLGLVYTTLGKGKIGENQLKWYENNIMNPYSRGVRSLATERVNMMADFKALKKELDVPKDLRKKTESGFTNEQAVRTYLWSKNNKEVPGLSKRDVVELSEIIEKDPKLKAFADQIQMILKDGNYSTPKESWLAGTITTDLIEVLNTARRDHYLKEFKENIKQIYTPENLNKLEAIYGKRYRDALENSLERMKSGTNRTGSGNKLTNDVLDYINGAQGTIMFFNTRSALLQTISATNFINLTHNNPYRAGKAFANQKQYWKDFMDLMNSDYLLDRRNGLKLNISESEIADAAATSKNKAKAAINYILEKGYLPTRIADSFAIASGGATWYRNKIIDLIKEGKTEAQAKEIAMEEFIKISEKSQQSSDPSKISAQQSSDAGRVFLQFVNTPMQYTRLQKRAAQDLINGRGDWKSNISKILYYGVMQNLWFNGMQQGLFALGFGDGEIGEKEEKKIFNTANGMADSILRGTGFGGMTVSVFKNTIIDIYNRSKKPRPEYVDSWQKLLEFSPAIKSKFSKLKSAGWYFDSKARRQEIMDKGFSLDNPAYEAAAHVITAATNIPLDRLFNKYHNLENVVSDETETWEKIASFFGWPAWQLESTSDVMEEKTNNPTKYEVWEQKSILKQFGLTEPQIKKRYKNKEERAKAILKLQNETNRKFTPKAEHKDLYYKTR